MNVIVVMALKRPYTFVVLAVLILIYGCGYQQIVSYLQSIVS
jgi:hypothetical protein